MAINACGGAEDLTHLVPDAGDDRSPDVKAPTDAGSESVLQDAGDERDATIDATSDAEADADADVDVDPCPALTDSGLGYSATCSACLTKNCCEPFELCIDEAACLGYAACVIDCATSDAGAGCKGTCASTYPDGILTYFAAHECLSGSCGDDCGDVL